ncbi:Vegetative incompatibility protein HET-E-1 [Durusdinium trenchii]|uniref:Vegetative incompatibility protein HET-E-1 n=1 Tax=Durusdinium trenchii TaxID=1381693 RepID=A0ABP0IFJ0_9DINO
MAFQHVRPERQVRAVRGAVWCFGIAGDCWVSQTTKILDLGTKEARNDDGLQDLRDALERAEEAVSASSSDTEEERERKEERAWLRRERYGGYSLEILDVFRTKLEELEVETQRFKLHVCSAMSGEPLAQVRLKPSDSVLQLCEAVVKEMGETNTVVSHSLIFKSEVGLRDGDTVYFARTPVGLWDFHETCEEEPQLRLSGLEADQPTEEAGYLRRKRRGGPGGALKSAQISSSTLLAISTEVGGATGGGDLVRADGTDGTLVTLTQASQDAIGMSFAHFSPCGKLVVTAAGYCTQIWDTTGNLRFTLHGHQGAVRSSSFSADSRFLLTASSDDTGRIWSCQTGKCLRVLVGHQGALNGCSFSPDGLRAMTSSRDGTVKLWEFDEGRFRPACMCMFQECALSLEGEGGVVSSACFSPEGSRLLIACASDTVNLIHLATGQLQLSLKGKHTDWVRAASFSPDGLLIATASYDGSAGIWSPGRRERVRRRSLWASACSGFGVGERQAKRMGR